MPHKHDVNLAYSLEQRLAQSIDKMRDNVTRSHALKRELVKLRRQRRGREPIPADVIQWFKDTAEFLDDDQDDEGE